MWEGPLFYAAEARSFHTNEIHQYQMLLNRMARHLCHQKAGGLLGMRGNHTMADLRKWLGWKTAAEYIRSRQLSYMGHLGRYSEQRIESKVLRSAIKMPAIEG